MKGTGELWNMSDDELKAQAAQNSEAWHTAETQEDKDAYHAENVEINKILDSHTGETTTFDPDSGTWSPRKELSAGGTSGQGTGGQGTAGKADTFTYDSAPEYLSKNQEMIDAAYEKIMGRPAFSYDPETDPAYQQYKDQYTRQGKLAMEDTLGQVSARTGGLASSYAGSAAQQSYNQYMSALGDKIPELRQLAYQMYRDEGDDMRADLNMLLNKEQMDYGRYQDRLGQYNADRSFAYGAWSDQRLFDEDKRRDERDYGRRVFEDERDYKYKVDQDTRQNAIEDYDRQVSKAVDIFNATGDVTGLAEAWDLTPEQAQGMIDDYARKKQLTEDEAARQVADWYAQYGDFSKLKEIGVDTGYLEQEQMGQQATGYGRKAAPATPDPEETEYSMDDIDPASVASLGVLGLNYKTIETLVEEGKLEPYQTKDGRLGVKWAEGYDATRWWKESGGKIGQGRGGNR